MVSTQHLIKDQITGRHAGGAKHGILNPFRAFASASFSSGCPSCNVGAMSNSGVGLNGYVGRKRCGCPAGCSCCG